MSFVDGSAGRLRGEDRPVRLADMTRLAVSNFFHSLVILPRIQCPSLLRRTVALYRHNAILFAFYIFQLVRSFERALYVQHNFLINEDGVHY